MSTDTAISMAVAHVESRERLNWVMDGVEAMYQIQLDREHITAIWQDIKRVPLSRAL